VFDLAVGAAGNSAGGPNNGALHLLMLNSDGSVKDVHTIGELQGGFEESLDVGDSFAATMAVLGDLNGDGVIELAVTQIYDDDQAFNAGALWIFSLSSEGFVKGKRKIGSDDLAEALDANDEFGRDVAVLGDLDGDGVIDLAVGAYGDGDGAPGAGSVWILFLNADGSVRESTKISATQGGFTGALNAGARFGSAVEPLGDLDGDGVPDLAVGASRGPFFSVGPSRIFVLFLNSDGTVREHLEIGDQLGGLSAAIDTGDLFGEAIANLGDLDGDGVVDLAVGANGDDDGGLDRGAVHVLFLNGAATANWRALHPGLAGASGVPNLVIEASMKPRSASSVRLTGGAANAAVLLAVGSAGLKAPFMGGVMYPDPLYPISGLALDGNGAISQGFSWPADLAPGTEIWVQGWIADASAPFGVSATGGLVGVTP